jgi:UDP-N-acetylglucosamine 2-epimerase (non-hydrolysing)
MKRLRIMPVFGTRPEAIKMAPVIHELWARSSRFEVVVTVTGQHREMLNQALDVFGICPSYDIQIMEPGQSLAQITTRVLSGLDTLFRMETPDMVLVHGDTTTTFASALAAFYHKMPVGHVEAGLRSNNKYEPFPEEGNRRLTADLVDLHLAPTERARSNLLAEGVSDEMIVVTGNTVIDAVLAISKRDHDNVVFELLDYGRLQLDGFEGRILLVEAHRRENWGGPMVQICQAILEAVSKVEDMVVVFPVHRNPVVRDTVRQYLLGKERIYLIEPPPYDLFVSLLKRSYVVLTDSGGLQEESPALAKPVLVLRDVTERPEVIQSHAAELVGTCKESIVQGMLRLFTDSRVYDTMTKAVNPYGDGLASRKIADAIEEFFRGK